MAYTLIADFASGVDLRKSTVTAKAGSLRVLSNGFVNAGGEIEKRRRLAQLSALAPGDTFGLAGRNNEMFVFGTKDPATVSVPAPLKYHQLVLPGTVTATIARILDVEVFNNRFYVIARFIDGVVRHFYDGAFVADGAGSNARAYKSKLYAVDGELIRHSAVGDPTNWTTGTGAGFIDGTTQDVGAADFVGLESYYNNLALFGRRAVQVWAMDPDPAKNQLVQVLGNIGLIAPNAAARYGNGDVLFLSDTGIRSIRARDASNAAILNDVGSPIDPVIVSRRLSLDAASAEKIKAMIDPLTGHFWLVWGATIYVLAYYPSTKITAWSTFDLPVAADYVSAAGSRIAVRAGDAVYVYGGADDPTHAFDNYVPALTLAGEYDDTACVFQTPFLDMGSPATVKRFEGIDVACEGVWKIEACPDHTADLSNPSAWTTIATVAGTTYSFDRIPFDVQGTHIAIRATSQTTGPARVGAIAVHHDGGVSS